MSNDLVSSDLATIDLQTGSTDLESSASSVRSESFINRPTPWRFRIIAPIAGMILAISATPATAIPDYWFLDRRRRDAATVSWVVEGVVGMPISRAEALRIVHEIIERAERGRLELAKWEAERGLSWEDA